MIGRQHLQNLLQCYPNEKLLLIRKWENFTFSNIQNVHIKLSKNTMVKEY